MSNELNLNVHIESNAVQLVEDKIEEVNNNNKEENFKSDEKSNHSNNNDNDVMEEVDDEVVEDYPDNEYEEEIIEEGNNCNDDANDLNLARSDSYVIVKSRDLEAVRNQLIAECSEFICMDPEDAILVLIQYEWNIDKIKDNWYDNVEANLVRSRIKLGESSLKELARLGVKPDGNLCNVCFEPRQSDFFALKCGHYFCNDCWTDYVDSKLDDLVTIISTACLQKGCNLIVPEHIMLSYIDPNNQEKMDIFRKGLFKNFTDNNKDIKWCPTPNCGICIRCVSHSEKEIICECKGIFCFGCGNEGHRPCKCNMIIGWEKKNHSESENVQWLLANAKQCPNCHKYIEKNQGCNHMTCNKSFSGCGYEFCWICMGEWAPHGSNWYNCSRYDEKSAEEKLKKDHVEKAKTDLAKYVHYFDRYMNHHRALKITVGMRKKVLGYVKSFNEIQSLNYEEVRFLEESLETIIKSRRMLKNTYIFGYYMKDVNEKQLYEHQQSLLERDADLLLELMENDSIPKLLKIDNFDEFNKEFYSYKASIINLASATNKYMENLLNDIELSLIEFVDYKAIN